MQQKNWGTSFVEAKQLKTLLNLFLELTVVQSGLRRTPCCHSEQQSELWESDRLKGPLLKPAERSGRNYALVEAKLIVAHM